MSRKHNDRKWQQGPQHIVVGFDGAGGGLEPDCPICAMLAAQGQEVLAFDPDTMDFTPERIEAMGPVTPITLELDAMVASILGAAPRELDVPRGMLVGEFLIAVRFIIPELAKAFPDGGLELRREGRPLGWAAPIPKGAVTLVAKVPPRQATA